MRGRVRLNGPQVTDHVTGDIGGTPARARRWRVPAVRRNPREHSLKAVERKNETVQNHASQYLPGPVRSAGRSLPEDHVFAVNLALR